MIGMRHVATIVTAMALTGPAAAADRFPGSGGAPAPVAHDEWRRAIEELTGQLRGLGSRFREHFLPGDGEDRPLITLMLLYRSDLALTPQQVEALERLRSDFQREAIRREADLRVAEMDLAALRRREPLDLGQVEQKVREIERLRADQRLARIRAIEQGKAQLTPGQRDRLRALLEPGGPPPHRL